MTVIEDLVVWLLAAYGCASLMVTLLSRCRFEAYVNGGEPLIHYQVLLYNSEHALEAVVRRLLFTSVLDGEPIRISFVDHGSTDDTLKIAAVFERNCSFLNGETRPDAEHTVTIDLRKT
jgi:hypothetical protein